MSESSPVLDSCAKNELSPLSWNDFPDKGTFLWTNCKFKDFQIVIDDRVLDVHKCVLAARSPVFAAMLTSGLTETKSGQLVIQDFDFITVQKAIKFCYSDHFRIPFGTRPEIIWNLLTFGHKYDIQPLIRACLHQIRDQKNNFNNSERKFLITSAVNLGFDQYIDTILKIFGAIEGEIVLGPNIYKEIGDVLAQDDSFKDLKIICDNGEEFFAHKCILALKSLVFAQMFDKMAENGDNSGQLTIKGIKPVVVFNAVMLFYTGRISNETFKDNSDLFLELLEFAGRYKVHQLVTLCLRKMDQDKKSHGQEVVGHCIKTAFNFKSKKIFNIILGIFGTQGFEQWNVEYSKASKESYWN